jgi:hypothetical protein
MTRSTFSVQSRASSFVALGLLCVALAGCAGSRVYEDPVPVMVNRQAELDDRKSAMTQAEQRFADDPRRIKNLYRLVFEPGQPSELRLLAVDQLVKHDEAGFRTAIARDITRIGDWPTLRRVFELGVQRHWPDFTPVVVRNWARPAHGENDDDRLERRIIQELHPGQPVEAVVFDVFARQDKSIDIHEQVAAWELLNRIAPPRQLMADLAKAPDTTPLVVDLKACAADLHVVPANNEGVRWLFYLREPARKAFWDKAKARVAQLNDAQRDGLELRHLAVLTKLDPSVLAMDRNAMLARVAERLRDAEQHLTGPTYDGPMRDHPQLLHSSADKLAWADLATIDLLLGLLHDRAAIAALFRQADADVADTSTEYGGVIDYEPEAAGAAASAAVPPSGGASGGGGFTVTPFEPLVRVHDLKYLPPPDMIERMYTAVAHYHFHAQSHKNSDYAGPGLGDLKMADRLRPNALVFTFIDDNRLNVDYYQPGFIVVDLGTVHR